MDTVQTILPYLIHVGAMFYLTCFLFRDQVLLRTFAILGDFCYTAFYFSLPGEILWSAVFYSFLNMVINVYMISLVLNDRRHIALKDDDMRLYQGFAGMSPGDFRRLSKLGTWHRSETQAILAEEGKPLDQLYYVLEGTVEVTKAGRNIPVSPGMFVGEVAYLKNSPASATVMVKPGSLYMAWTHDALRKAIDKHDGLRQSLSFVLSSDLAAKVARS